MCADRAINSQRFIEFTREDLQRREEKHAKALKALEPQRKLLSKEDADKFFDRLINDAEKRKQSRWVFTVSLKLACCVTTPAVTLAFLAIVKHRQSRWVLSVLLDLHSM